MVWGAISYKGTIDFVRAEGTIDSQYYCTILTQALLPESNRLYPDGWVFMQDNAPCHTSNYTKQWLEANDVETLEWPAKSPDLNPIENVWADVSRRVYRNKPP